jgi:tetratricopeptide (TPR) repeat protein
MKNSAAIGQPAARLDYYSLLGVSSDATQDEIESRYHELVEHMDSEAMPAGLREWATRETALLDEAYAVLSDPERRAQLAVVPASGAGTSHEAAVPAAGAEPPSAFRALFHGVPWTLAAMGMAAGAVVLGVLLFGGGLLSGAGENEAAADAQGEALSAIDTDRVAELVTLVNEDPNNMEALFELGETFFLGGEWQAALDWFARVLELDPGNVHAQTDVGTANFNLGRYEDAKAAWLAGLEAAPDDVQLHYNMGFLYANVEPVDFAAAMTEWGKVVELAPGSDLAATAQVHLDGLAAEPSPGAAPEATAPPAP